VPAGDACATEAFTREKRKEKEKKTIKNTPLKPPPPARTIDHRPRRQRSARRLRPGRGRMLVEESGSLLFLFFLLFFFFFSRCSGLARDAWPRVLRGPNPEFSLGRRSRRNEVSAPFVKRGHSRTVPIPPRTTFKMGAYRARTVGPDTIPNVCVARRALTKLHPAVDLILSPHTQTAGPCKTVSWAGPDPSHGPARTSGAVPRRSTGRRFLRAGTPSSPQKRVFAPMAWFGPGPRAKKRSKSLGQRHPSRQRGDRQIRLETRLR